MAAVFMLASVAMLAASVGPHEVVAQTAASAQAAAGVIGFGFWATLGCIGCIAGFVVGAGTTIAGLAVFLAANPEIAILCVSTCAIAAT
jgi:hypothetical protein